MITNFALSLSFDGIRLLQRVQDGWHLVGETELDVPNLSAELAKLHEKALLLDPTGLRTKLLIPNEQIKYLTLETAQTELSDVIDALDGATPYAIDELVIDFDRNGGRTYIAAVARETLEEAENFAVEHDFGPVSFAAISEPLTFRSEVFFGPTSAAKASKTPVEKDKAAVKVTGTVAFPEPEPEDTEDPPLFTPRARMASPESVVHSSLEVEPEAQSPAPLKDEETATETEVLFTRRNDAPTLAVPTGTTEGPAVGSPSAELPSTPKPIVTTVREPTIAPVVKRVPQNPPLAPIKTPVAPVSAPQADDMAAMGGFASRRGTAEVIAPKKDNASAAPAKQSAKAAIIETKQAKTTRGKPRFLGLILTAILLLSMALVALWASTLSEEDLSNWFGQSATGIVETTAVDPALPETDPPVTEVTAVTPEASDAAVLTAQPTEDPVPTAPLPQSRDTQSGRVLSPAEADRLYAATGVWQRAPRLPVEPRSETLTAPIPSQIATSVKVAQPVLPDVAMMTPDLTMLAPVNPPAPGSSYPRDADGFILATPEGTITPYGTVVFAGAPSKRPPERPNFAPEATNTDTVLPSPEGIIFIAGKPSKVPPRRPVFDVPQDAEQTVAPSATNDALAGLRPAERPEGIAPVDAEAVETAFADPALSGFRPKTRPAGLAPAEQAAPEVVTPEPAAPETPDITAVVAAIAEAAPASTLITPTARAVAASRRPDTRPRNFSRVVARATDLANQQAARAAAAPAATATASAPAAATDVANDAARPSGAISGGVAQAATLEGAIRLRDINLIGVYGRPNDRRALVRLGNGRYVKVEIGSSLDGGQVTAIGDNALNYVKRGKTYALQLPAG